ncbi:hypothetical protein J7E81_11365 [Bacillus sp. ISL-18]|uniref:hypothetical protein n=1 Tax=Bacillus sp. ISL-18 TaxID=2819118 RepID=UPI001BE76A1D|nr:hypothetical protein [Bacillus sp. ISL-18]MBT2655826.1 hypothetical protein [Bacillus sp. ISL-18]
MFENFEIIPQFEGTAREHPHFSLSVNGSEYKGMIQHDTVHWYQPHPKETLAEEQLEKIESKVIGMMSEYKEQ